MSSAEAGKARMSRRSLVRGLSLLLAVAPALSACSEGFKPLYGVGSSSAGAEGRLARVDYAPIPGRVGQRIRNELDVRSARACASVLVALHSFTPVYMDKGRRWHVGVLYGRDPRLGRLVREGLRSDGTLIVGDNQPYAVSDASDYTIIVHGEQRGLPHVELEIRQDLLASESDVQSWAKRLGGVLEAAVPHVCPT